MKSLVKILIISALIANFALASQVDELMKQGNDAYKNGNYKDAVTNYEKLVHQGYEGVSLFYNLGNAYYKDGKLGYAILNYEKALRLSPNDDDIQHNLAIANAKTVDKIDTLPKFFVFQIWESLLSFFSIKGWTYLVYSLFILILIAAGIYFFAKGPGIQRYSFFGGLAILFLFIMSVIILTININRDQNVKQGVIIVQSVSAKLGPDVNNNDAFVIHEGLE
ncbi:MAG: tetratricopeptide repeat protein, partial [Ignavibacteriaceae bacterium]